MIEIISKYLREGINSTFRYQQDPVLLRDLSKIIIQHFDSQVALQTFLPHLKTFIIDHDYRLVAEYLATRKNPSSTAFSVFQQMLSEKHYSVNNYRYSLAYSHFLDRNLAPEKAEVIFTQKIGDIFLPNQGCIVIWLHDEEHKESLITLLNAVGAMFGTFIEQQYDVPGLNAVVRQGVVRSWHLPNATAVVSKRESSYKKGRFEKEQANYKILLERLGKQPKVLTDPVNSANKIIIQIAYPFAVIHDSYSGKRYALSSYKRGISLEEIFLIEKDQARRNNYLGHYRLLLDVLFDHGVLWGDMSPRNILIDQQGDVTVYTLLDFEKTHFLDKSASQTHRIEHCRGQICIEEMGVLCTYEEMLACFNGYFNPSEWDLDSDSPLPFLPRPDIADILHGRGIMNVKLGAYNKIDQSILAVRILYNDLCTKSLIFPGHIGFKVEHYLSCAGYSTAGDYDRKTTEILIAAKRQECFDDVVRLFIILTNSLEVAFLKTEFIDILRGGFSGNMVPPSHQITNLVNALDTFYQMRESKGAYRNLIAKWLAHLQPEL